MSYACDLVDKYVKDVLKKNIGTKTVVSTVPKRDLVIALPYLDKLSLQIRKSTNRIITSTNSYTVISSFF